MKLSTSISSISQNTKGMNNIDVGLLRVLNEDNKNKIHLSFNTSHDLESDWGSNGV